MSVPPRLRRTLLPAVGLSLLAVMIWQAADRSTEQTPPVTASQAAGDDHPVVAPVTVAAATSRPSPAAATDSGIAPAPPGDVEAAVRESERFPSQRFEPEAYAMGRMQIFGRFWRTAEQEWDLTRFRAAEAAAETLDGRESYQVYVYLRTCLDAPRSAGQAANLLQQIESAVVDSPRLQHPERVDQILDRVDAGLARCEGLPEDLEPLTLTWLTRAATRGYPLAQIAYYRSYRWLASRKPYLLFGEFDGVRRYRQLAPHLLRAALGSGHAEALVEMATAYADGVIFERDPVEAYAWSLAADEAGRPDLTVGDEVRANLAPEMDDDELAQARLRAVELCEQYCP